MPVLITLIFIQPSDSNMNSFLKLPVSQMSVQHNDWIQNKHMMVNSNV